MKRNIKGQFIGNAEDSGHWKGGKVNYKGYIRIFKSDHPFSQRGYVLEHRLKMEEYLERYLTKDEIVHHIDGNKANNFIGNLILMNRKEHQNEHRKGKSLTEETRSKISNSLMGHSYFGKVGRVKV